MRAVISLFEDGNKEPLNKQSFSIADEADLETKAEDIKDFIYVELIEEIERVGI